jgi:hypothetical protein
MAATAKAAEGICAREGCDKPRQGEHSYCSDCRTEVRSRYQEDRDEMMRREGWNGGAEAMRTEILKSLRKMNPGGFLVVHEIGKWIEDTPSPART